MRATIQGSDHSELVVSPFLTKPQTCFPFLLRVHTHTAERTQAGSRTPHPDRRDYNTVTHRQWTLLTGLSLWRAALGGAIVESLPQAGSALHEVFRAGVSTTNYPFEGHLSADLTADENQTRRKVCLSWICLLLTPCRISISSEPRFPLNKTWCLAPLPRP